VVAMSTVTIVFLFLHCAKKEGAPDSHYRDFSPHSDDEGERCEFFQLFLSSIFLRGRENLDFVFSQSISINRSMFDADQGISRHCTKIAYHRGTRSSLSFATSPLATASPRSTIAVCHNLSSAVILARSSVCIPLSGYHRDRESTCFQAKTQISNRSVRIEGTRGERRKSRARQALSYVLVPLG
jgi:hypothetical protein